MTAVMVAQYYTFSLLSFYMYNYSTLKFWSEHKIPITHLHRCHLLDYEQQLPSIILSHCHYSLKVGRGQDVKYDHQALQKHILDLFIHGKPVIVVDDIPQVVYKKDIYTTGTFADVRKKVAPQVSSSECWSRTHSHSNTMIMTLCRRSYSRRWDKPSSLTFLPRTVSVKRWMLWRLFLVFSPLEAVGPTNHSGSTSTRPWKWRRGASAKKWVHQDQWHHASELS